MPRGIRETEQIKGLGSPLPAGDVGSPIFSLSAGQSGAGLAVIGKSPEMMRAMRHARVAAACLSPVLITGERGTGKELLARVITANSDRRDGPITTISCDTLKPDALESALFGHEKGAFTGARTRKPGAFESSADGTVILEEVATLSNFMQGRLHRALKEKRYLPVGGIAPLPMTARVILTSSIALLPLLEAKEFREDLFYLVNIIPIELPPLRERREDIGMLAEHFLRTHSRAGSEVPPTLPPDDLDILRTYDWPGNVEELESLVERAVVMGSQSSLYMEELARLRRDRAQRQRRNRRSSEAAKPVVEMTLAEVERKHILDVLEAYDHNQRQAAKALGINPSTLWRKLKAYGLFP
jgi:DNA-binding NtrC family response regulator